MFSRSLVCRGPGARAASSSAQVLTHGRGSHSLAAAASHSANGSPKTTTRNNDYHYRRALAQTSRPFGVATRSKWATPRTRSFRAWFSTESWTVPGEHEISDRGSKLWDFEQMDELSKNRGNVVIIDTREPSELKETGRIPGAINLPIGSRPDLFFMDAEDFSDNMGFERPGPEEELVFYCKAGVRSRAAAALAREAGWQKIGEYPGSWVDWEKNGGKVEKDG